MGVHVELVGVCALVVREGEPYEAEYLPVFDDVIVRVKSLVLRPYDRNRPLNL